MSLARAIRKYRHTYSGKTLTRSHGALEYFSGRERAQAANKLIPQEMRVGRLLDIGCGSYPLFLLSTKFSQKFGIDKMCSAPAQILRRFNLIPCDVEDRNGIPIEDNFLDVVTMLSVFEHIEYAKLPYVFSEIRRVLKPGGVFIITVPSTWSDIILRVMARLNLVSRLEMADHKTNLSNSRITNLFKDGNFTQIESGYFECFLNRCFAGRKGF